ncbi:MAG: L,D-transpeptidase family protein [Pseudomonadota bacterium]|nr:L,D-transpeptidase family protein [Pseudomonadota bacterium]
MNSSITQGICPILLKKCIFFLILVSSAAHSEASLPFSELMRARIEQMHSSGSGNVGGRQIIAIDLIADTYVRNGFQRLWGQPQDVKQLIALIQTAADEGLNPEDYLFSFLTARLATETGSSIDEVSRDLLLSDIFLRLAYHYYYGKTNPKKLYRRWNFSQMQPSIDPVNLLLRANQGDSIKESLLHLLPAISHYEAMRKGLKQYRNIDINGGWGTVPAGPLLKKGTISERIPWLQSRLRATGDLALGTPVSRDAFTSEVEQALIRFQQRHGLNPDGIVGPATLAELNVPIEQRIDQIRVNMERLRWVSRALPDDYLLVDIAEFRVMLYQNGQLTWTTRAVVGRPYRKTPVFRSTMSYLVINPTWTVPPTILKEDLLPKLRQDSSLLTEKKLTVIDHAGHEIDPASIDWSSVTLKNFNYNLRQRPGSNNALGRIKFMFPNNYSVYLHDTPSKNLFDASQRAFSSGCIRIEDPLELAELLLQSNDGWDRKRLEHEIATGQTRTVKLKQPIPVLLMYFTAEAREDSLILFRKDLYDRDASIVDALNQPLSNNAVIDMPAWYQ